MEKLILLFLFNVSFSLLANFPGHLPGNPLFTAGTTDSLYIFWASESAEPGEGIAVQGSFSDTAHLCLASNNESNFVQLSTLSQQTGFIKVQLPDTLPVGVYRIRVKEGRKNSQDHFINQ